MPPKRQPRIDYYYPTPFQRMRDRMVSQHNENDVPQDAINLIQSFATYKPLTREEFRQLRHSYRIGINHDDPLMYSQYLKAFLTTPLPKNRENYVESFASNWLLKNFTYN